MARKKLFTETISGLFGGVSTQPEPLRFPNQCTEQDNFLGTVGRGLERRNGTDYITQLDTNADEASLITKIDKAGEENFITVYTGDAIEPLEIFTLDGTKQNVLYEPDARNYIITDSPRESIRTALIADYSIVVNNSVEVATTSKTSGGYLEFPNSALIWVKIASPTTEYTLTVADTPFSITTTQVANTATVIDSWVAEVLPTGWNSRKISDSVIELWKDGGAEITDDLQVTDAFGDLATIYINKQVEKDTDLPPVAPEGYIVNITGLEANDNTNWYVKFNGSSKTWKETIEPNLEVELDRQTMPHFLIRTAENLGVYTFIFCSAGYNYGSGVAEAYSERLVGDDITNALPSFVGERIVDTAFYRNRLVFLSGASVVMSRANDFFNYFASTATDTFADDPIDVSLGSNVIVSPQFLGEYQGGLLVFTENEQFSINSADDPLEPNTVRSDRIGSFTSNGKCLPLSLGTNLYFTDNVSEHSVVREYYIRDNSISRDTLDITGHAEEYIPQNAKYFEGIVNKRSIFLAVEDELDTLYVYKSFNQGTDRVQSAWSKLTFNDNIVGITSFNDVIYLISEQGELLSLDLFNYSDSFQLDKEVPEDWDFDITANALGFGFTLTLPYTITDSNSIRVVADGKRLLNVSQVDTQRISVSTDVTSSTLKVGYSIPARYDMTTWYFKDQDGTGVTSGHLNIRSLDVSFEQTAAFDLEINPVGRDTYVKAYHSTSVGEDQVGILNPENNVKKFGVNGNTKTTKLALINNSVFRSRFIALGFEGAYRNRGQLR
jgi:hypothetical protein